MVLYKSLPRRAIHPLPARQHVELSGGEVGIVITQNPAKRLQPRVVVVQDPAGNLLVPQKLIDVSRGITAPDGKPYRIRRTLAPSAVRVDATNLYFA